MFTGIIEAVAKVRQVSSQAFWLDVPFAKELKKGQSVACNGVCLTVVEHDSKGFKVELLEETKRLTAFSQLKNGSRVNVERAMKIGDRFDGHICLAHSEGVGDIRRVRFEDSKDSKETRLITVKVPQKLMRYMVHKGIVILDGIALTLTRVDERKSEIEVAIIPHTWENTNLSVLLIGDRVNIETDVVGKWVEKLAS